MGKDKWVIPQLVKETLDVSDRWIEKQRQQYWEHGREYLDISSGAKPSYRYNLALILQNLKTHPAQRR